MSIRVPTPPDLGSVHLTADDQVELRVIEHFAQDSDGATLEVVHDASAAGTPHRHLTISNRPKGMGKVNVVTFPGYLVVTGDRGSWTFAHWGTEDMLTFFNSAKVNLSYWSEKLDSGSARKDYTPEVFLEIVAQERASVFESINEIDVEPSALGNVNYALQLLADQAYDFESSSEAYSALGTFSVTVRARIGDEHSFRLEDVYEHDLGAWDYNFVYVCHLLHHVADEYFATTGTQS